MSKVNFEVNKSMGRIHTDLYKELEIINFESTHKNNADLQSSANTKVVQIQTPIKTPMEYKMWQNSDHQNQYDLFRETVKWLLFCGQCLGLNPVLGIFEKQANNMRFKLSSWKFVYSVICSVIEGIIACLCIHKLLKFRMNIATLTDASFYGSIFFTTCIFMRVAWKWPGLAKKVSCSELGEYIDQRVLMKCKIATVTLLLLSFLEYLLSFLAKITVVLDCFPEKEDVYRAYSEIYFSWLYELGLSYNFFIGFIMQIVLLIATVTANYSDLFIICMSFYLTSILNTVNEKIVASKDKIVPPAFWRELRVDYTRATHLVSYFDYVISSVIFSSFATNMFFICLQLFNLIGNGFQLICKDQCPNYGSGPLSGFEQPLYVAFSFSFRMARSLMVFLVAGSVHSATRVPAPALHDVPSQVYCEEVQRFIEQVHANEVALSGLRFFYVTQELVLSVAGTIVTYELVLLQFNV